MKVSPAVISLLLPVSAVFAVDTVKGPIDERSFQAAPMEARTWTWWHRMNGFMTKEGITADLEAMKRGGLGGAQMFDVSGKFEFTSGVKYMSPEWLELTKFCASEAARLGLKLGMHNSAGWSSSGGPWVPASEAMQVLVDSETHATGPSKFDKVLPKPQERAGFYADTAVIAFPLVGNKNPSFDESHPQITATLPGFDAKVIFDNDQKTTAKFPVPSPDKPQYIQFDFPNAYTAQAVSVDAGNQGMYGEVHYSKDGQTYEKVREFYIRGARGKRSFSFPPVTAQHFRIVFTKPDRAYYTTLDISEVILSPEALIDDWEQKAGYQPYPRDKKAKPQVVAAEDAIPVDKVVDLTSKMTPDGRLQWDVPEGKWVILRLGHTPLGGEGNHNHPAADGGEGFEVDKFSEQAVRNFWAGGPAKVIQALGPLAGTTLTDMVIDSYERGQQQWTAKFPEEFEKRRGYSLVPYYPTLTGRVVGSVEQSERFLWDVRRTIGDLFAEKYAGTMAKLAHENNMILASEPAGFVAEMLYYLGQSDMPVAVTWVSNDPPNTYGPASAAHIYGKQLVGGEVMTAQPKDDNWTLDPYAIKSLCDADYCSGINRFLFHTFAHQPWSVTGPGMTAGQWGSHFDRKNTWWDQGRDWRIYLARCQYMLQQGYSVADGMTFCGESVPVGTPLGEAKTKGYKYDGVNADVILNHLSVKDGKLVLPNGSAYAYLNLSDTTDMTVPVLKKIRQFVQEGATLIGDRTLNSPSLQDYPQCDEEIKAIANELWGDAGSEKKVKRPVGKGTVYQNYSVDDVFKELNVQPDFSYEGPKDLDVRFIHRRTPEAEIYFVSSQSKEYAQIKASFRVADRVPEFWDATTGEVQVAPVYQNINGRTELPISFAPKGSMFVVFRNAKPTPNHLVAVDGPKSREGAEPVFSVSSQPNGPAEITTLAAGTFECQRADGKKQQLQVAAVPAPVDVVGPWVLSFPPDLGAPPKITLDKLISWTEHSDPGVKYFSGSAVYSRSLDIPADLLGAGRSIYLELGDVKNLASVKLNGQDLGIAWKPPYRIDLTKAAKAGANSLEIELTNLWPNRLIGDEQLPPDSEWAGDGGLKKLPDWFKEGRKSPTGRVAFVTWHHWKKDDKLLPSGLLGPVKILTAQSAVIP